VKASGTLNTSHVLGVADVRRALLALPDRLAQNSIRRALYAGGNLIRDDARNRAPTRQSVAPQFRGSLKKSIVTDTKVDRKTNAVRVRVFIKAGKGKLGVPRRYAHLVEFGTKPHMVGGRAGSALHPGARAQPFLRPAFETRKLDSLRTFTDELRANLAEDVRAVASRRRSAG
jgi:HK97 gp10 family phage protein